MSEEEQTTIEQGEEYKLPFLTKAGIVAGPGVPAFAIDALTGFHGGNIPIALVGLGLAGAAAGAGPLVRWLGKNERFLLSLARHPEHLDRLDFWTKSYFRQQIIALAEQRPDLFYWPEEEQAEPQKQVATDDRMEELQPKPEPQPKDAREEERKPLGPVFPVYPDNEALRLGKVIATGQRFDPHMNQLLGRGMVILGNQGSGKSNLIGDIAESAGRCEMAEVVIDYKREFYTLAEVLPSPLYAGHPSFESEAKKLCQASYFGLTEDTAAFLAGMVMSFGYQLIIDVPSYGRDFNELARVLSKFLHALMDWSQSAPEEERHPCLIITDEAHHFLPEERKLSGFLGMTGESFNLLVSAYSRLGNTGRSYGYTLVYGVQRIVNILKAAIANLLIKVIMYHQEENDLDRIEKELGKEIGNRQVVKALKPWTGIIVGFTEKPMLVLFDEQCARHVSNTPMLDRVQARRSRRTPRLSQVLATYNQSQQAYQPVEQPVVRDSHYSPYAGAYGRVSAAYRPPTTDRPNPLPVPRMPERQPTFEVPEAAGLRPASAPAEKTMGFSSSIDKLPEPRRSHLLMAAKCYQPGMSFQKLANAMNEAWAAEGSRMSIQKDLAGKLIQELKRRRLGPFR